MGALAHFESFIEGLVEGPFRRLPGGKIQLVQLAKQIEREMDAKQDIGPGGKVFVPNRFTLHLNPADHAEIAAAAPALARELATYAVAVAGEHGFSFFGPVRVALAPDAAVPLRQVRTTSDVVARPDELANLPPAEMPQTDRTQTLNVAQIVAEVATASQPAAPVRGQAFLLVRDGPAGRLFPLERNVVTIGRALDNDLVIEHPSVSRHHAEVRRQAEGFYLVDMQSTNGTLLNGRRIATAYVGEGDRIQVGDVELRLQVAPAGEA